MLFWRNFRNWLHCPCRQWKCCQSDPISDLMPQPQNDGQGCTFLTYTGNHELSCCQLCRHCQHHRLSPWRPVVSPMMTKIGIMMTLGFQALLQNMFSRCFDINWLTIVFFLMHAEYLYLNVNDVMYIMIITLLQRAYRMNVKFCYCDNCVVCAKCLLWDKLCETKPTVFVFKSKDKILPWYMYSPGTPFTNMD